MKKFMIALTALVLLTIPVSISADSDGDGADSKITWYDFNTGFAKAKESGKIAVIDCYTEWCGWCKVMDKKTFSDDGIAKLMNEKFIPIKFNPEIKDEKYYINGDTLSGGQLLYALSNNKPSGYPTFFFFIPQNTHLIQQPGYQDVPKFTKTLDDLIEYQSTLSSN